MYARPEVLLPTADYTIQHEGGWYDVQLYRALPVRSAMVYFAEPTSPYPRLESIPSWVRLPVRAEYCQQSVSYGLVFRGWLRYRQYIGVERYVPVESAAEHRLRPLLVVADALLVSGALWGLLFGIRRLLRVFSRSNVDQSP